MSHPIEYYQGLITSQYNNSVRFKAWLDVNLIKLNANSKVTDMLDSKFDIDTAIGKQLDILGELLGQPRSVRFQPTDGTSPTLTDSVYRLVLKSKILLNQWDGMLSSIADEWGLLFPSSTFIVRDNQDMSMDIIISVTTPLERDLLENGYIVPKPQGVRVNYYFGTEPFFGYDIEDDHIKGYDIGQWAETKQTISFAYDIEGTELTGYDLGYWIK